MSYGGYPALPGLSAIAPRITVARAAGTAEMVVHAHCADSDATGLVDPELGGAGDPYELLEWSWDFGDPANTYPIADPAQTLLAGGTPVTVDANSGQVGPEALYRYTQPGTYTITLTARGNAGTVASPAYVTAQTTTLVVAAEWFLYLTGQPTGGTFTLSIGGTPTAPIAHPARPGALGAAASAVSGGGAGSVFVYGDGGATAGTFNTLTTYPQAAVNASAMLVIRLCGSLAGTNPTITADGSGLTGGTSTPTAVVFRDVAGSTAAGITVAAWSGTTTYFDSGYTGSNGASDGSQAKPWTDWTHLAATLSTIGQSNVRALLALGSVWNNSTSTAAKSLNNVRWGTYAATSGPNVGATAKPIVQSASNSIQTLFSISPDYQRSIIDLQFKGIDFRVTSFAPFQTSASHYPVVIAKGSNYTAPTVTVQGASGLGSGATFSTTVVAGQILAVQTLTVGTNYDYPLTFTVTDSTGSGAVIAGNACLVATQCFFNFNSSTNKAAGPPYGRVRHVELLDCSFSGATNTLFDNELFATYGVAAFDYAFVNCTFTRGHSAQHGIFCNQLGWRFAVFGCSFAGGDGDVILDHHIYPESNRHGFFAYNTFGPFSGTNGFGGNYGINGNTLNFGDYCHCSYHLVHHNVFTGTQNGADLGATGNFQTYETFDRVIYQGNVFHDLGNTQSIGHTGDHSYRVTMRDNAYYNLGFLANGSPMVNSYCEVGIYPADWGTPKVVYLPYPVLRIYRNNYYCPANRTTPVAELLGNAPCCFSYNTIYGLQAGATSAAVLLRVKKSALATSNFAGNTFYNPVVGSGGRLFYDAGTSSYLTFAQYQGVGTFDASSAYAGPAWPDPAHGNFGSVAIVAPAGGRYVPLRSGGGYLVLNI